jgi:CHAT domain-containing protein/tetratricopeptide (TPR) repeat protein
MITNIVCANVDSSKIYLQKGADFFFAGDFNNCLIVYNKALNFQLKSYPDDDVRLGRTYNNIGLVYLNIWNFEKSIQYLKKAQKIYSENGQHIYLAIVYSNLGANYKNIGDFRLAKHYFEYALQILQNLNTSESNRRKAETLNRLGILQYHNKDYKTAIKYYNTALKKYSSDLLPQNLHDLYQNLSNCYLNINQIDSALVMLHKALKLSESHTALPKKYLAITHQKLYHYYLYDNNKHKSEEHLFKALEIFKSIKADSSYFIYLFLDFADYYASLNNIQLALKYYNKATNLIITSPVKDEMYIPNSSSFINPIEGILLLRKKAELLFKVGVDSLNISYLETSIDALQVASELLDKARTSFLSIESKLSLADNESIIYQLGIFASYKLFILTEKEKFLELAYKFSEKSKSSVLESSLQEQKAKAFGGIPDSLLLKEEKLKRDIAFYNELIYKEKLKKDFSEDKLRNWQSTLISINEEYENLKKTLEKNYKNYFQLKYVSPYSSLENVKKQLGKNTTLLEYALTDSILFIFQIDNKNTLLHTKKIDSSFFNITNNFLSQFKNFDYICQGKNIYAAYQDSGSQLYDYLINSVKIDDLNENLVIIPDNILSYIPFEALVKPSDKVPKSYTEMHYLLYDYTFSYSYSAHLFLENNKKSSRKFWNKALTVAPEYKSDRNNPSYQVAKDVFRSQRDNLDPLPFALEEANLVSKVTFGRELSGSEATENNFLQHAPDFNILHLAMHTLIDDKNPLYSRLVFYAESNDSEAGFLTTNEIFSLKLKADMTVLSACSSGEGEYRKGEGVLSLARSFFYAGCPSLVMTLWNVDDESGLRLMKDYYKHLRDGLSKAKAMQLAKIDYISDITPDKQHPFYWSNYICIGNSSALYLPIWIYLAIISLFSLFPLTLYVYIKTRKKHKLKLSEPMPNLSKRINNKSNN